MEKEANPKTKDTSNFVWNGCLSAAMKWDKCDKNRDNVFIAYFLADGKVFHCFRFWKHNMTQKNLKDIKLLTPCKMLFHWYKNWKRIGNVRTEELRG